MNVSNLSKACCLCQHALIKKQDRNLLMLVDSFQKISVKKERDGFWEKLFSSGLLMIVFFTLNLR